MTLREIIKNECKSKGISVNKLESELGFAKGYISKLDKSTPNSAKLQQIAEYFHVSLDYLMTGGEKQETAKSALSSKDEKDIAKDLNNIMEKLNSKEDGPINYNGAEMSEEATELFKAELELMLRRLKVINKEKYNPHKNKK